MFKRVLFGLLLCTNAHAYTITESNFSADSTISHWNNFKDKVVNLVNGNIEGSTDGGSSVSNIKADSVFEINMADDANPRVRDAELLGIGADSVSAGALTQATVVESGCVPADDTDLVSDISACVVYVNGYRVSKGATALTYTANRDNYVDLSQGGVYTVTAVANGATQPAVAANSSRLAKVVTDGTEITTITSLFTTRVPGLIIPANYRSGMTVSRDTAAIITIAPGSIEVNNTMITKTLASTLTTTTAGDWAGGSSLRAANTFGYVGCDTSGNLKLHTTAPAFDNYALSGTAGKKRYSSWSSTTYRIIGWFYMDGAQGNQVVSNIKEGDVSNYVISNDTNTSAFTASTFTTTGSIPFYSSGGPVFINSTMSGDVSTGIIGINSRVLMDAAVVSGAEITGNGPSGTYNAIISNPFIHVPSQAGHTYTTQNWVSGGQWDIRNRRLILKEE